MRAVCGGARGRRFAACTPGKGRFRNGCRCRGRGRPTGRGVGGPGGDGRGNGNGFTGKRTSDFGDGSDDGARSLWGLLPLVILPGSPLLLLCLALAPTLPDPAGGRKAAIALEEEDQCTAELESKTVSIVIPVLNEKSCIASTLTYLQQLDPMPLDVVVVDGGSSDGTQTAVKKTAGRGASLVSTDYKSRSKQMNRGARECKGDYIVFLHADTVPPLDLVALARSALKDPKTVCAGFVPIMEFGQRTYWSMTLVHALKTYLGPLAFRPVGFARGLRILFGDQAMLCRKEDFESVGGFAETLDIMEDTDLCLKLFYMVGKETSKCITHKSSLRTKGKRIVTINRSVHTSARRVARLGYWRTLHTFLVLGLSYAFGASPRGLNDLAGKVYPATR
mmetsp:Transcript_1687/g.3764  ORF Transcript_1687/g.3764 Transcript_1687/m.3764 type:complete len:392 (-) Transcript_1687:817-1992(-)|eukprot:CAMPEP_0198247834 /NCGR_PEP_ID=MMETSP1446-20131203/46676_1 /TAXON_ID=1461542 ORGANISM="Unidentified sp, Strain CCMP2111" /NCGR_SAMPLE_ID=MMETSP1446 /ASSEMBLY_ACC=CAM_ASM_001112 /LENGTH=391 /DNA_ID=CAMNT_0043932163 /DNA_START=68 /DNA_END=1243 /DNA_ORIENTATION=-